MAENMSLEIIRRYKDIIDDGEISGDILTEIIQKVGFLENLSVKCSNQSSFVLVPMHSEIVYQYFMSGEIANNIFFMISKLCRNPNVTTSFENADGFRNIKISYKVTDYLVPFVRYIPNNIIIWKQIKPLNSFDPNIIPSFIQENIYKLLWDIGKAILGLHNNYIIHCDISIDNIGILTEDTGESRFVLFDFDGSRKFFSYNDFRADYYRFQRSIKYHYDIGKISKEDVKLVDQIFYESLFLDSVFGTYMEKFSQTEIGALKYLETVKIKYI